MLDFGVDVLECTSNDFQHFSKFDMQNNYNVIK